MIRSTTKDFAPLTCSPETWSKADLEQRLSAMGFVRGSGNLCEYERGKHFIDGLNLDAHPRDRLIRWVIEYLKV